MNFIKMTIYDQYLGNEVREKNYVFFSWIQEFLSIISQIPKIIPSKFTLNFSRFLVTPHKHLNKISLVRPSLGPPTVLTYIV